MSVIYCFLCDRYFDSDFEESHFVNKEICCNNCFLELYEQEEVKNG